MAKKTDDQKKIGLTVRIPEEDNRVFQGLLRLNGEKASDVLKKTIFAYIKKYEHMLNTTKEEAQHNETSDN